LEEVCMNLDPGSEPAPARTAPWLNDYPQFETAPIPEKSGAVSAWRGKIKPFNSGPSARAFLRDAEAGEEIWISAGQIKDSIPIGAHWADEYLVGMDRECTVLILKMPAPAHPRAYLINPAFPEHYSWVHPHPRFNETIEWEKRRIPGLCVYSPPEFKYDESQDKMRQFLDQVTIFVGKHLIWLKTRQLFRGYPPEGELIAKRRPDEPIISDFPVKVGRSTDPNVKPIWDYWAGLWPGPVAAGRSPQTHLNTIAPDQECWCGRGVRYGNCHRTSDKELRRRA
jgi:hypothetical protein